MPSNYQRSETENRRTTAKRKEVQDLRWRSMHNARNSRVFDPRNSTTNTNSRFNMAGQEVDDDTKDAKLKAALWYAIGQTIDSVAVAQDINATPHFIGGLSEMVWGQIQNVAQDLEAFAKHNGRTTINTKDVLLLSRRNEGLAEHLCHHAETVSAREAKSNSN